MIAVVIGGLGVVLIIFVLFDLLATLFQLRGHSPPTTYLQRFI